MYSFYTGADIPTVKDNKNILGIPRKKFKPFQPLYEFQQGFMFDMALSKGHFFLKV